MYGGGGVTPDVTIEPAEFADLIVDLERRQEFFAFALEYGPTIASREGDIVVDDAMWQAFESFMAKDEFTFDAKELEAHRSDVELRIRRDMTRRLRGRDQANLLAVLGDEQLGRAVGLARGAGSLSDLFKVAEVPPAH